MKSNVKLSDLQIFEHASQHVAIVLKDGNVGVDNILHVFVNNDTLAEFLGENRKTSNATFQYVEDLLGTAAKYALDNNFQALSLHSIVGTEFVISAEDLQPLRDLLDSFSVLNALRKGKISFGEAGKLLKEKTVYFHQEQQQSALQKAPGVSLNFATKISAYLTYDSAVEGEQSEAIKSLKLSELAEKFGYLLPIVIEPKRDFAVEFSASLFQ